MEWTLIIILGALLIHAQYKLSVQNARLKRVISRLEMAKEALIKNGFSGEYLNDE